MLWEYWKKQAPKNVSGERGGAILGNLLMILGQAERPRGGMKQVLTRCLALVCYSDCLDTSRCMTCILKRLHGTFNARFNRGNDLERVVLMPSRSRLVTRLRDSLDFGLTPVADNTA